MTNIIDQQFARVDAGEDRRFSVGCRHVGHIEVHLLGGVRRGQVPGEQAVRKQVKETAAVTVIGHRQHLLLPGLRRVGFVGDGLVHHRRRFRRAVHRHPAQHHIRHGVAVAHPILEGHISVIRRCLSQPRIHKRQVGRNVVHLPKVLIILRVKMPIPHQHHVRRRRLHPRVVGVFQKVANRLRRSNPIIEFIVHVLQVHLHRPQPLPSAVRPQRLRLLPERPRRDDDVIRPVPYPPQVRGRVHRLYPLHRLVTAGRLRQVLPGTARHVTELHHVRVAAAHRQVADLLHVLRVRHIVHFHLARGEPVQPVAVYPSRPILEPQFIAHRGEGVRVLHIHCIDIQHV